jgi:hypothetical protein
MVVVNEYGSGLPAILDITSGLWRVIDGTAYTTDATPSISPDRQTIAYVRPYTEPGTIFLAPREGGEAQPLPLSRFTGLPVSENYFLNHPIWSPNGRQLAGRIGGQFGPAGEFRAALVILDPETETAEIHRPFNPPQTDASYPPPVWSPDGQWIAWEIITSDVDEGLWLFAADGSEELLVDDTEAEEGFSFVPIWLNNGRSLTFFTTGWKRGLFDLETRTYSLLDLPQGAWVIGWLDPAAAANRVLFSAFCTNHSEFVMDVTVPDGTHFAPGTAFIKTWRIRNRGTCTWDASYQLNFMSGERMSGPERMSLGQTVPPVGEIDISIDLIAPQAEGTYRGQWQLTTADGTPFGAKPYVEIVVP